MKPETLNELALFAGAGGGILGGKLLGWKTICAVEWDAYARDVLVARQNDGCLEVFPIWDDVQTFDGHPWRGRVDVVSGGFPCQDISAAGKGAGIDGERSGMWKHMARVIGEVRPRYVLVENSPMLVGRGLAVVIADLAEMGYDAEWGIVGAHHATAPHKRDRIWIMAYAQGSRTGNDSKNNGAWSGKIHAPNNASRSRRRDDRPQDREAMANASGEGLQGGEQSEALRDERDGEKAHGSASKCGSLPGSSIPNADSLNGDNGRHGASTVCGEQGRKSPELRGSESDVGDTDSISGRTGARWQDGPEAGDSSWWATEPDVGRVAHGVAARVDRLRCIGNGQVPAVVPLAWNLLRPTTDEVQ